MFPLTVVFASLLLTAGIAAVEDELIVRGVLFESGITKASVELPPHFGARWIAMGESIGPWRLDSVDYPSNEFTFVASDGQVQKVKLNEAVIASARDAWIRSTANPMFYGKSPLTEDVISGWRTYSAAEKEAVYAFYRSYGWEMRELSVDPHRLRFDWRPIHLNEMRVERTRLMEEFMSTLDPDLAQQMRDEMKPRKLDVSILTNKQSPGARTDAMSRLPADKMQEYHEMIERTTQPRPDAPLYPPP